MKCTISVLAMVAFVAGGWCGAADVENPYKKAKVGDWVSYTQTANMVAMNMKQSTTMKQTVKAKDEKEVTLLIEVDVNGNKVSNEVKIPLDQPYDPNTAGMPKEMDAKIEKIADGKESVTVAGKPYDCQWSEVKISMKSEGMDISGTSKSWTCADVPLSGLVKSEGDMSMNAGGNEMKTQITMELNDCGRGQ